MSTSRTILEQLRKFGLANPTVDLNFDELPIEKTLGVLWASNFDAFLLPSKIDDEFKTTPTKSKFLGVIAKVFDPLGQVAPVVFVMKILMQEIWKLRVDWEGELPASVVERVTNWCTGLKDLENLKIRRCYRSTSRGTAVPQGVGSGVIDVEDPGRWPLKFDFVFCI